MIIDSQIHAYEANTPKRPWRTVPNWPPSATGEEQVAAQDELGIDGAIFIAAFPPQEYRQTENALSTNLSREPKRTNTRHHGS